LKLRLARAVMNEKNYFFTRVTYLNKDTARSKWKLKVIWSKLAALRQPLYKI